MIYAIYRQDWRRYLQDYGNAPGAIAWCSNPNDALNADWCSAFAIAAALRRMAIGAGAIEIVPVGEPLEETPFSDLNDFHAD